VPTCPLAGDATENHHDDDSVALFWRYLFSNAGIFVPWNIRSHDGTFVLRTIRSLDRSFPGKFAPWTVLYLELSFLGPFVQLQSPTAFWPGIPYPVKQLSVRKKYGFIIISKATVNFL